MHSRYHAPSLLALALALTGCAGDGAAPQSAASQFGEANRQTMMAQVIDPDPQYDSAVPETSGNQVGQAIERYRTGKVKQPKHVSATSLGSGSGSGSGGN